MLHYNIAIYCKVNDNVIFCCSNLYVRKRERGLEKVVRRRGGVSLCSVGWFSFGSGRKHWWWRWRSMVGRRSSSSSRWGLAFYTLMKKSPIMPPPLLLTPFYISPLLLFLFWLWLPPRLVGCPRGGFVPNFFCKSTPFRAASGSWNRNGGGGNLIRNWEYSCALSGPLRPLHLSFGHCFVNCCV